MLHLKETGLMKKGIHPSYNAATVNCACGNVFETRTTVGNLHLDICNMCHPFFTGTQKIIDTEGRVERFMKKYRKEDAKKG
jgi:large subunit ribosomal protein L31